MTDIQQARDVLAKWREGSTPGPWNISATGNELRARDPWNGFLLGTWANGSGADQALIVGTAGNPEFLNAIDDLLAVEQERLKFACKCCEPKKVNRIGRIAASIIAADARITS